MIHRKLQKEYRDLMYPQQVPFNGCILCKYNMIPRP